MREEETAAVGRGSLAAYVVLVALASVAAVAFLPTAGLAENPVAMLTSLVLTAWVGSRAVHIPRLRVAVTAGDAFMFCGLIAVGPMAAPVIAVAGILGVVVGGARRPKPIRAVFNIATVGLAAAGAAHAYLALSTMPSLRQVSGAIGLLAAAAVFVLVNTVLVALALRLERGMSFLAIWRDFMAVGMNSTFASLLVGLGLHSLYLSLGAVGLVTGLAGSAMIGSAVQAFRDRMSHDGTQDTASSL